MPRDDSCIRERWATRQPSGAGAIPGRHRRLRQQELRIAQHDEFDWRGLEGFAFGDGPELADRLAGLVLAGLKTATCWAASDGALTEVGKMMVLRSGAGRPLAVVRTIELTRRRFDRVDAAFAFDEGEGDRSLEYWRRAHRAYFTR